MQSHWPVPKYGCLGRQRYHCPVNASQTTCIQPSRAGQFSHLPNLHNEMQVKQHAYSIGEQDSSAIFQISTMKCKSHSINGLSRVEINCYLILGAFISPPQLKWFPLNYHQLLETKTDPSKPIHRETEQIDEERNMILHPCLWHTSLVQEVLHTCVGYRSLLPVFTDSDRSWWGSVKSRSRFVQLSKLLLQLWLQISLGIFQTFCSEIWWQGMKLNSNVWKFTSCCHPQTFGLIQKKKSLHY